MTFETTAAGGLASIMGGDPLTTTLVLAIMGLCWFVRWLLMDAKDERGLNRQALKDSTAILSALKESIDNAIKK